MSLLGYSTLAISEPQPSIIKEVITANVICKFRRGDGKLADRTIRAIARAYDQIFDDLQRRLESVIGKK